jgi:iron(III) transport system substrate-binding protein
MKTRFLSLTILPLLALGLLGISATACGGSDDEYITVYAGRSANLVGPLLEDFAEESGIKIRVRYGDGTDLALGILEEGNNSPADVYYGQDVGALGALKADGRLTALPDALLQKVPASFRSPDGLWVGTSGRARVIVYNTDDINPNTLPSSILDYTQPQWKDRVGFVPRSDGFPEFVTALRVVRGEAFAKSWLESLKANNARAYPNNLAALQAVANNEVDVAFLNHYYLYRFLAERGEGFKARNYYFTNGDLGGLFLVAGAAVLSSSKKKDAAFKFVEYLLSEKSQKYFAENDHEYPLVAGVPQDSDLPPLSSLRAPDVDLSDLDDLRGSLELMRQAGILP